MAGAPIGSSLYGMTPGTEGSPLLELGGTTVVVHVFPDDPRLLQDVRRTALAMQADVADAEGLRDAVERGLRPWYPRLTISERDDLARLNDPEHVWYVMRDGRVRRPREQIDRLYSALATARDTSEQASEALRRADAAIQTARHPRPSGAGAAGPTDGPEHDA